MRFGQASALLLSTFSGKTTLTSLRFGGTCAGILFGCLMHKELSSIRFVKNARKSGYSAHNWKMLNSNKGEARLELAKFFGVLRSFSRILAWFSGQCFLSSEHEWFDLARPLKRQCDGTTVIATFRRPRGVLLAIVTHFCLHAGNDGLSHTRQVE